MNNGFCIYCGSQERLSDEHIIPFSLGGTQVIKKASCKNCEDITKKFEGVFTQKMIGNFRNKYNAPSRRKKYRPKVLPLNVQNQYQNIPQQIPVQDHLASFALPLFSTPKLLHEHKEAGINFEPEGNVWIYPHPDHFPNVLPNDIPIGAKVEIGFIDIISFARCLAKMAYCNCLKLYGFSKFYPFILPLILVA